LADLCQRYKKLYAAAARWFAEAFAAEPQLSADLDAGHRYYAARAAVRAGCGQGRDAAGLDDKSRASFRRQALDWLQAELEARRRLLETDPAKNRWIIACDLQRWFNDPGFAGVREPNELARLPEAERQAWRKLWADIADIWAQAEGTTLPR